MSIVSPTLGSREQHIAEGGEYGYLLPGAGGVNGGYATRLLAAVHARSTSSDFVLVRATTRGWRTLDGRHTPQQAARGKWGIRRHVGAR